MGAKGFAFLAAAGMVLGALLPAPVSAAPAARSVAAIYDSVRSKAKNPIVVGQSILDRDDNGLSFTVRTSGLKEGHAYTVWIIIMQKTDVKEDKMIAVHASGGVVQSGRQAFFSGRVGVGRVRDARGDKSAVRFGGNFHDPRGAKVMFAIVHHGEAVPDLLHEQLTTRFGGRCSNAPANKGKKIAGAAPCVSVQRSLPHVPGA